MSVKVKEKIAILEKNGCMLLQSSQYPKSCNSKVDILCNCGHTRNSALSNIVLHEQFKCKECIKIKKSTSIKLRKNEYKNNFERTIISFENRFLRSNKYRDDFNPNNISKTLECRECKIHKPLYRFYNRRGFNGGKEKLCKNCVDNNRKRRVQNYSKDQVISCILNACRQKSNERSMKGRPECGIIDIDLEYVKSLIEKQHNKCAYSQKPLSYEINNRDKISIDRIDSTKGYIKGNIQLVCSIVNWMKLDMCEEDFLGIIARICNQRQDTKKYNTDDIFYQNKVKKRVMSMIKICRSSASKRKWERCRPECGIVDIDKEYIIDLIEKQNNRCVYSGMEFDWDKFQNNPYQASIDRIDNDKGYIKGNVQIVCNIINQMKSNLSDPVFYDYVNSIHEHRCI